MLVYSKGQTLYHKETVELVRITCGVPPGKEVTLVSSEGRVFVDNVNNYSPIIDESGVVQHGLPKIGEPVDFTLRKYIASMQERKQKYAKEILGCPCKAVVK